MWYLSQRHVGIMLCSSRATRSSQYGMVMEMPLDLVADVRCFLARLLRELECESSGCDRRRARESRSPASRPRARCRRTSGRRSRSTRPRCSRAPRRNRCRRACGRRAGTATPGISRTGRRFTYWSNSRRNWISEPQSEMWSGTFAGQPTAPKKIASWRADLLVPVVRHHLAVLQVVVAGREVELVESKPKPNFARRGLEHAHALGHDFLADAVAGNDGDAINSVCRHGVSPNGRPSRKLVRTACAGLPPGEAQRQRAWSARLTGRMSFSEIRQPLFRDMRWHSVQPSGPHRSLFTRMACPLRNRPPSRL